MPIGKLFSTASLIEKTVSSFQVTAIPSGYGSIAKMPICRFCSNDRKLIDAHIIPRGFWPSPTQAGTPRLISSSASTWPRRSPTGVYDQNILCADCDGYLGRFDQHSLDCLLNTQAKTPIFVGGTKPHGFRYDDADATLVELFAASVAWRASATSHEFFKAVDLGPYNDRILTFLKSCRPEDSPIKMFMAEFDNPGPPFLNPHYLRMSGAKFLLIYASRFIFYLKLDKRETPSDFQFVQLQSGEPVMTVVREWETSKERTAIISIVGTEQNRKVLSAWNKMVS